MHYKSHHPCRLRAACTSLGLGMSLTLCAMAPAAYAARPMITDDARITDANTCQLESWAKTNRDSTEYWALPACNLSGNFEVTLGGALTSDATGTHTTTIEFQGKTLFKTLEPNSWGLGLSAGTLHHPQPDIAGNDWYAYVPASLSFADDRFVLHSNMGWSNDHLNKQQNLTWGLGSETRLSELTWLIAETFGQNHEQPLYQLGLRYWMLPNRVQIDMTYGNRIGNTSGEQWFSIGMRLLSQPLLP